jgi:TRAP-type C4-dicarboxylate transport system permease small subunit
LTMADDRDPAVLDYRGADERGTATRPVSRLAVVSWIVFLGVCVWLMWGMLKTIQIFYDRRGGGPGPSGQWERVVLCAGACGAAVGVVLAAFALRNRAASHIATVAGLVANGLALAVCVFLLA